MGEGRGWVENRGAPKFSPDGTEMVLIQPVKDGKHGHFPHILHAKVDTDNIIPPVHLTGGTFEVTEILDLALQESS